MHIKQSKIYFYPVVLSVLILMIYFYCISFPDYEQYNYYLGKFGGYNRFILEPISAFIIFLFHLLGFDSTYFYIFCSIIYAFSVFYLTRGFNGTRLFILVSFLIFSPLSLILYQTPRFVLGISFFSFALYHMIFTKNVFYICFFLILSMFSHVICGLLSIIFISLLYFNKIKFKILVFCSVFFGVSLFLNLYDSVYLEHNVYDRGLGRYFYVLILSIYCLFICLIKSEFKLSPFHFDIIHFLIFFTLLMSFSPYFHRFSALINIAFPILFFLYIKRTIFFVPFYFVSMFSSFFILYFSKFGY